MTQKLRLFRSPSFHRRFGDGVIEPKSHETRAAFGLPMRQISPRPRDMMLPLKGPKTRHTGGYSPNAVAQASRLCPLNHAPHATHPVRSNPNKQDACSTPGRDLHTRSTSVPLVVPAVAHASRLCSPPSCLPLKSNACATPSPQVERKRDACATARHANPWTDQSGPHDYAL